MKLLASSNVGCLLRESGFAIRPRQVMLKQLAVTCCNRLGSRREMGAVMATGHSRVDGWLQFGGNKAESWSAANGCRPSARHFPDLGHTLSGLRPCSILPLHGARSFSWGAGRCLHRAETRQLLLSMRQRRTEVRMLRDRASSTTCSKDPPATSAKCEASSHDANAPPALPSSCC